MAIIRCLHYRDHQGLASNRFSCQNLAINYCLEPCSHYSVPQWIKTAALPEILGENVLELNDDKIYCEFSKIQLNQAAIENFLFEKTYEQDPQSYDYVNYDLSSSYFVGLKCKLSAYGSSKDTKAVCKQGVLALMGNSQDYLFKWDAFAGFRKWGFNTTNHNRFYQSTTCDHLETTDSMPLPVDVLATIMAMERLRSLAQYLA